MQWFHVRVAIYGNVIAEEGWAGSTMCAAFESDCGICSCRQKTSYLLAGLKIINYTYTHDFILDFRAEAGLRGLD